eukprot:5898108-Alexandrium_andersonii.AAC.1
MHGLPDANCRHPPPRIPFGNNRDRGHQACNAQLPSRRSRGCDATNAHARSGPFAIARASG